LKERLLGLLSICRKAGKLALGFDPVKRAVFGGDACLVLAAEDMSQKTTGEMRYLCSVMDVEFREIPVTINEIWFSVAKKAGLAAVTDAGLAGSILKLIPCDSSNSDNEEERA